MEDNHHASGYYFPFTMSDLEFCSPTQDKTLQFKTFTATKKKNCTKCPASSSVNSKPQYIQTKIKVILLDTVSITAHSYLQSISSLDIDMEQLQKVECRRTQPLWFEFSK